MSKGCAVEAQRTEGRSKVVVSREGSSILFMQRYLSTMVSLIVADRIDDLVAALGSEAGPARVGVALARWRDWLQASKIASALVKNLVLRRALVLEVDESGIRAADGSDIEMAVNRGLCTLLRRRRAIWVRVVLEVEPVIAVDISKNILGGFILGCNVAIGHGESFNKNEAVLDSEQASEEHQELENGSL